MIARRSIALAAALALLAAAAFAGAWRLDRDSVEHAARLHRAKAYKEASRLYAVTLRRAPGSPALRYDYGTALLAMNNPAAGEALIAAAASADGEVRLRALNNLGLWRLGEAASALGQKRAKDHALAAAKAFRDALRQQPGYADASWNLTIALRLLASIDQGDYQQGGGDPMGGTSERPQDMVPADDAAKPDELSDQDMQKGPMGGEGETAARAAAAAPLSQDEAGRLLATSHRDPTPMAAKLMALEGRVLRRNAFGK